MGRLEHFRRWWTGNGASVFFMKYVPVINTIILVAHIFFLLAGKDLHYAEMVAGSSLSCTLLLLALSFRFKFCKLHKALIYYDFFVEVCMLLRWMNIFKGTLMFFRWFMLLYGIVLLLLVAIQFKFYNNYNIDEDDR